MAKPSPKLRVFLCHASEDKPIVRELYDRLRTDGFDPWLDSELLVPGKNWPLEIQKAMRASQAVLVCLSKVALAKEGYIHTEIKTAQALQMEKPEGTIFFIPLQLEECDLPFSMREIQWGKYFEADGYEKLVKALNKRAEQVEAAQGIIKSRKRPRPAFGAHLPQGKGPGGTVTVRGGDKSTVVGGNVTNSIIGHTVTFIQQAPPAWHRPAAPRPVKPMVGRKKDFDKVAKWLRSGKNAAITAAVQGMPGVGKTVLAEHLAFALDGEFPGGVIYQPLGTGFRNPALAVPILEEWAGYAGRPRQDNLPPRPEEVRTLLARHGSLLVVLDDVWDIAAIQPLLNALPPEACLLVTTRSRRIAQELHGEIHPLDVLSDDDARELLKQRLHPSQAELPLLKKLARALGNHTQALDIAAGSLARRPRHLWQAAVDEMERQVREGSGFGELHLTDDEDKESRVEAALAFSYHDLKAEAQRRFRYLGAFAPDASFSAEAAAAIWGLKTTEEAEIQLAAFAELGLLSSFTPPPLGEGPGVRASPLPLGEGPGVRARWQQHTILRAYALALLKKEGEEENARNAHAHAYNRLMREADDRQIYFLMRPDYPQLQHAFAWAIAHDLGLAQGLAGNTANLQAAFYLVRENYAWATQLAEKSKDAAEDQKGAAMGTLGNALARLAASPGEDRRARLLAALAAYEEALRYRRPDTAPLDYAATQNNLGYLHLAFIGLPGEDEEGRYRQAVICVLTALTIFAQIGHAPFANQAAGQLRGIRERMGANSFASLWKELGKEMQLDELPEWLR